MSKFFFLFELKKYFYFIFAFMFRAKYFVGLKQQQQKN